MGNFLDCFKTQKDEYASFINNDNLLLSNIQDRLEEYDNKVGTINQSVTELRNSYGALVRNLRVEITDVKKDFNHLEKKYNKLNDDFRTLNIENKSQEEKIIELEGKMDSMEGENIFLDKSMDITASSKYLDSESRFTP
jgi:chromosome segregation ATPase